MFPENISKNFNKVRQIAFSNLPMDEKMKLFESFDEIMVFYKDNITFVKNCFLPIEGFGDYAVNPFGDVISSKGDFLRLLLQGIGGAGYLMVNLCCDGKSYDRNVHRLVCDTFSLKIEDKPHVNHIDGNKENNRLNNLEYCTAKENIQHAYRTGLHSKRGKLTEDELNQIVEMLNAGAIYREIADRFDISSNLVNLIATGRSHKELYDNIKKPEKSSKTHKIKIRCIETGKIYNSQTEAAMDLNINKGSISRHLKDKYSHAGGYHFIRVEEKEI